MTIFYINKIFLQFQQQIVRYICILSSWFYGLTENFVIKKTSSQANQNNVSFIDMTVCSVQIKKWNWISLSRNWQSISSSELKMETEGQQQVVNEVEVSNPCVVLHWLKGKDIRVELGATWQRCKKCCQKKCSDKINNRSLRIVPKYQILSARMAYMVCRLHGVDINTKIKRSS